MRMVTVRRDLRGRFGSARDQGTRATCLAFAMSDTHAALRGGAWNALSCEYLFYHAKQRDGTPADQGTTIPAARSAMAIDGQPLETAWPYLAKLPCVVSDWRPPANVGVLYRRSSTRESPSFAWVWEAIEKNQPVILHMTISSAFYEPDLDGVIDSDEPANHALRHAVVAVATGERAQVKMLLVRNSWGGGWGLNGHAWLSEKYVASRIMDVLQVKKEES